MVMQKLGLKETELILKNYKLPTPVTHLAKNKKEVLTYSKRIGFPVVMKISSPSIIHKTDVGGVKLNINNEFEAGKAYEEIMKKVPKKNIEGVIIQKMHDGHKIIIGMKRDAQFGPVIAFGLGGIFVEVFKDFALRVAPLTKKDCMSMIKEIRTYPILAGARGRTKANMSKLVEIIMKISRLAMTNPKIWEIDLNPVIINKKEAVIVDARFLKNEP
jgi:acetyl-CoA synthetase (ADP-forming)